MIEFDFNLLHYHSILTPTRVFKESNRETTNGISLCFPSDLNSPLLFGRLNGLSSDSTIDILYQLGTTQDAGTKDRYTSPSPPPRRPPA